jgi:hypothetical protein
VKSTKTHPKAPAQVVPHCYAHNFLVCTTRPSSKPPKSMEFPNSKVGDPPGPLTNCHGPDPRRAADWPGHGNGLGLIEGPWGAVRVSGWAVATSATRWNGLGGTARVPMKSRSVRGFSLVVPGASWGWSGSSGHRRVTLDQRSKGPVPNCVVCSGVVCTPC